MIFRERISLITGASQGIGEAVAHEFAAEGAAVMLVDIQKAKLDEVAKKIAEKGGKAAVYEADVSKYDQANAVVESVIKEYKKIDHLINNAGITKDGFLLRMKEEEWDAVIAVNLKGIFNFSKAVIRSMIGSRYGRIVNLSSVVGLMGNAGQANYAASKAGLIGFTKSLAREVASRGITVNAVAPGFVRTEMTEKISPEIIEKILDQVPMRRFAEPREISRVVVFLAQEESSYITGQIYGINGGLYM